MPRATARRTLGVAAVLLALAGAVPTAAAATRPPATLAASAAAAQRSSARPPGWRAAGPHPLAVGTVVRVSPTGGLLRHGVLVLLRPNGRTLRLSLSLRTRVFQFRGRGVAVARISIELIVPGDVVVVRGLVVPGRGAVALVIYDTSFNGTVNPGAAGQARPLARARR